jgi:hypothetical protein
MTLSWVGCQQELGGLIENGELSAFSTYRLLELALYHSLGKLRA